MPWSLRKFLSKDTQQTSDGGDKGRSKSEKSSKRGKIRQHFGKGGGEPAGDSTNPIKDSEKLVEIETNLEGSEKSKLENSSGKVESNDELIDNDAIVKSDDDDYKSIEDFPQDCSNLTGYLESAIMESACNTLERYGKSIERDSAPYNQNMDNENLVNGKESNDEPNIAQEVDAELKSSSFDRGLYIEYVNYDILGAEGGSNGSSGEYYSSDEEKFQNSNNNSNNQLNDDEARDGEKVITTSDDKITGDSLRVRTGNVDRNDGANSSNNIPELSYYGDLVENTEENRKNEKGNSLSSSSAIERNQNSGNGDKSSEKDRKDIDPKTSEDCERKIGADETEGKYSYNDGVIDTNIPYHQQQNCPVHNGNVDLINQSGDNKDMEKARSIFGMCLCQNGEQVDNVTDLDFRNCNLKQVPHDIFQYAQTLTHLQLDSNTLSDLPKSLFSCENLEYLTVSDNDLGSLPPTLAGLSSLRYLDISKNVIEDVPDCIRCCKSLSVLDASVNPIERLSEGFTQLVGLHELYLNDCFLEFLPASFGRLVQLNVLELRDNQLQILPKSIRRLTLLKRLDLGGNIFQEWPDVVCELRRLTELWLDGNELSRVPDEIGELTSLVYLDLSRNFIEAIPSQIGELRELTDLILCENHITALPDTIGFLDKLTLLKASMNQLTGVPETLGKLREIEELDLSHNKMIEVPSSIGNLTKMHTCLLDNNVLSSVPPELGRCVRLNVLQLSRNMLEEIPREIGELSQLRVFNICRNRLPHLPITVIKLAQLEALWVSSNQSKPNVPLHAEIAKDGKTRILTNILFPQVERDVSTTRERTDGDGYAIDAADDDEPPLFRKQRGITRVAFNLQLIEHSDMTNNYDDDDMSDGEMEAPLLPPKDKNSNNKFPLNSDHHVHSVDVSADIISNGNKIHVQSSTLMVRSPEKQHEDNEPMAIGANTTYDVNDSSMDTIPMTNGGSDLPNLSVQLMMDPEEWSEQLPSYNDITSMDGLEQPQTETELLNMDSLPDLVTAEGNIRKQKPEGPISFSTPDLSKTHQQGKQTGDMLDTSKSTTMVNLTDDSAAQPSKIKTWSSHSHLPAIPGTEPSDVVQPVAAEIMNKDDRSSMSSSPVSTSESPKPELAKINKLPIPSQALYEKHGKEKKDMEVEPKTSKNLDLLEEPQNKKLESRSPIPLSEIPFMDSDVSDVSASSDRAPLITKPKKGAKPPPPPRKDSLLLKKMEKSESSSVKPPIPSSKPYVTSSTGLKVFTPAFLARKNVQNTEPERVHQDPDLLALPIDNKPPSELSPDGLASTDRDSGVGNDVDSQESIPECQDEDLPLPPHELLHDDHHDMSPVTTTTTEAKPMIKSIATFQVNDHKSPYVPSSSNQDPNANKNPPPLPNKVSANIKMFESISSPEHKLASTTSSKSLADLLPTGPRKTEEKAIIRPNNHLNGFVGNKSMPDIHTLSENKPAVVSDNIPDKSPISNDVIMEQTNQVMFVRSDDEVSDSYAFHRALDEVTSPVDKKKISRSNSKTDTSSETVKHDQFRERLEKIMQQQRNVSAATKAAQSGAALSLSRKTSFNTYQSQPTSPDGSGLENLTAENAFGFPETVTSPGSPEQKPSPKKHSVHDRMKSKLDRAQANNNVVKSASSSRIARSRPGSAPAAQLLQRRNSNQRNSIAAPENSSDEKRTLAPLYGSDERAGLDARARSKSIEQQLGQLFLDSEEEQLNHDERANYERQNHHSDVIRREHKLKKDSGVRGSRNSLCSPPPVRHNMYAKARSSTNASSVPLADWKHKLLQHIERKRLEKQQVSAFQATGRPRNQQPQQSIGRIKSPPRTSGPSNRSQPQQYDQSNYVTLTQPQPRHDNVPTNRQMSKSVTAPSLMAPTKTITNTHTYNPEGPAVRSHFAGNSRAAKLAKQRTFTPGPETSHGNPQVMAPRPKSAMDKFVTQSPPEPLYAEPPSYRQPPPQPSLYADLRTINPPLPTYEDHLHRRAPSYPQEGNVHRLVRSESQRKSFRSNSHSRGDYDDIAGYPLRHSGSHESLMDAARYNQHDPYFPTTPIRNASSHDSVLDQQSYPQPGYPAPYYSPKQTRMKNNGYPPNHIPQRYPVVENPKRNKYPVNQDYATYVNVYDYDRSPVEYHNRPQVQSTSDPYRSQLGYRGGVRNEPRQHRGSYKHEPSNYKNYAYPPTSYHNARQPPTYDQHYRQRESISPTSYRPLAEREEGSVASAFRPYHQVQQQVQPTSTRQAHHHHHPHQMPYAHVQPYSHAANNVLSPVDYKNPGRHMSPPSNYQYMPEQPRHMPRPPPGWSDAQEDFERVTVSVRRNPTFGFHVMGGVGAGGNPYQAMDDGVFVTHVTPGGAAENKLQAGDKILLVNGSDFVGISHKRAVDLLRNAGQVAVLVVERSLGKPV